MPWSLDADEGSVLIEVDAINIGCLRSLVVSWINPDEVSNIRIRGPFSRCGVNSCFPAG